MSKKVAAEATPKPEPMMIPFTIREDQRVMVEIGLAEVTAHLKRNPVSYEEFDAHLYQCESCAQAYYNLFAAF